MKSTKLSTTEWALMSGGAVVVWVDLLAGLPWWGSLIGLALIIVGCVRYIKARRVQG